MGKLIIKEFGSIVKQIRNDDFRGAVIKCMEKAPDYIVVTPASSGGKYHPRDEIYENGMIKHINRCAVMAEQMVRKDHAVEKQETPESVRTRDILLAACILHDIYKQGYATTTLNESGIAMPKIKHTIKPHPGMAFKLISEMAHTDYSTDDYVYHALWDLAHVCLFHEGRWTIPQSRDLANKSLMTAETGELCKTMHVIDYVVSRREIADEMQYENKPEMA